MGSGLSLGAFAGKIGVSRSTINEWMAANPEFSEAVSRAKSARLLHWELAGLSVAKEGGGAGAATMIVFGLKNMGGDEWTDTQKTELTGAGGGPIQTNAALDLTGLTPEQLRALASIKLSADA